MLTCKEASFLASKKLDQKLVWRERIGLYLHIAMCDLCRRYVKDIKNMQQVMQNLGKTGLSLLPESVKLSRQSRDRIKQALDKALQQTK